jgi:FAD/FMN-containing dehydrogenase
MSKLTGQVAVVTGASKGIGSRSPCRCADRLAPKAIIAMPALRQPVLTHNRLWTGSNTWPSQIVGRDGPCASAERAAARAATWLSASLLEPAQAERLTDALFAASRYWSIELQPSKGLAGAPADALAAARDTATNPAVLDAFALAIVAGAGPPAYPEIAGRAPDLARARRDANAIARATAELRKLVPNPGSYVSESDFFEKDWQNAFSGDNYPRLRAVKAKYDPNGLFFVHHGVGSEDWSADGFTRLAEQ